VSLCACKHVSQLVVCMCVVRRWCLTMKVKVMRVHANGPGVAKDER
jgi:hypothetical protein